MTPIPAVQVHGNAVIVTGQAVADLRYLVRAGIDLARTRDEISAPARVRGLLEALEIAHAANPAAQAMSERGHTGADIRATAESLVATTATLSAQQVGERLHLTDRQVRRLASEIGGRRGPGGVWLFPIAAVEAYELHRQEREIA